MSTATLFTTAGQRDPFGYWHDAVCCNYTALSTQRLRDDAFMGEIRVTGLTPRASLSVITASPQIVRRTRADIAARPSESVFVNVQLSGRSAVSQRGIEARVPSGSFVVLDARQTFAMRFDDTFRQACLHLPADALDRQGVRLPDILGRVVSGRSRAGAAVLREARALLSGGADDAAMDGLVGLIAASVAEARADIVADQHLALIRAHVADRSDDPDLSPALVARRFCISTRHLHKLFARGGESFGRFLLRTRLARARARLADEPDRPLADIALACGFGSASHFARSFHAAFGVTAREMRRMRQRP